MIYIGPTGKLPNGFYQFKGDGTVENPWIQETDVNVQDQVSPPLILPLVNVHGTTVLTQQATMEMRKIYVANSTGISAGKHIRIINSVGNRYYFGTVLSVNGLEVTVDTPIDYAYLLGSEVTFGNINMAVDGSATPVHFHLRTGSPSIPVSVDITRLIMVCECHRGGDLNQFGDIPDGLRRGLVLRLSNGELHNILNVKKNRDLTGYGYDYTPLRSTLIYQGINGFSARITFNGQEKMGVALRILQDGQMGFIVQDDLTSLISLVVYLEGHVTVGEE